jgi:protein gp37
VRIPYLLKTPAAVRFLSVEPMIGPVDLTGWLSTDGGPRIDWVIVGGESGPNARPMHAAWVRAIRDQCLSADAPFFFKQWGEYVTGRIIPDDSFDGGAVVETESRGLYAISISHRLDDEFAAVRVGKKYAGRHLDGRLWEEYPDIVEIHPQKKRR